MDNSLTPKILPEHTAVLVVHGVGDPNPGDALRDLSSALTSVEHLDLKLGDIEFHSLRDRSTPDTNRLYDFFPMALREGHCGSQPIVFAEVFWGQVGALPRSVVGVIRGLFSLIFGLQSIMSGNRRTDHPKGLEALITNLGTFGAHVLRGPIFAINVLMLFATIAFAAYNKWLASGAVAVGANATQTSGEWKVVISGIVATVALGIWVLLRAKRPKGFKGIHEMEDYKVFGWSCIGASLAWPLIGVITSATNWQDWSLAAGFPLLLFFTLVSLCLFAAVLLHVFIISFKLKTQAIRHSLSAKTLAFAIQFGLWSAVVPVLWLTVFALFEKLDLKLPGVNLVELFHQNVPAEGLQWLAGGAVTLAFIATWYLREKRFPTWRLIIGWLVQISIIAGTFYGVLASLKMLLNSASLKSYLPDAWYGTMSWVPVPDDIIMWLQNNEPQFIALLVVVLASSAVMSGLRAGLDVANDVTNYLRYNIVFYKRNYGSTDGKSVNEGLRPIRGKFNEVLRFVFSNYQIKTLFIVSHSLGTVIALDELAHSNFGQRREDLQKLDIRIVTMGTPISHLFQHYFPVAYPDWDNLKYWGELKLRIKRWLNLYRRNDFVGTRVIMNPEDPFYNVLRQVEVRKDGGHTNYWRDRKVVNLIASFIEGLDIVQPDVDKAIVKARRKSHKPVMT